jgi:hypothetical protein
MSPTTLLLARWGFSLAFGITGLYLISVALRLIIRKRDWKKRAVRAEGTIVGFAEETPTGDRAGHPLFAPFVTFTTASGESIEFKSSRSERPNPYTIGQRGCRALPAGGSKWRRSRVSGLGMVRAHRGGGDGRRRADDCRSPLHSSAANSSAVATSLQKPAAERS